jgi:energy-converting hydrogenase Eha subunit C
MIYQIIGMRRERLMKLIAFILLIIGTVGLLLNELVFDWGRVATLLFAASNLIGLVLLGISYWRMRGY